MDVFIHDQVGVVVIARLLEPLQLAFAPFRPVVLGVVEVDVRSQPESQAVEVVLWAVARRLVVGLILLRVIQVRVY